MKVKPSMSNKKRWKLVERTTKHYARVFGLRLRKVKPLGRKAAGKCYWNGTICISLYDSDGPRTSYFVLDSIAHELAHLAFFNHRSDWVKLFASIISRMANDGAFDKFRKGW